MNERLLVHPTLGRCIAYLDTINREPDKATIYIEWLDRLTDGGRDWSRVNIETLSLI